MRVAPAPSRTVLAQSDVGLDGSLDLPSRMGIVASGIDVLLGVSAPEGVRGTADWVAILGAFRGHADSLRRLKGARFRINDF